MELKPATIKCSKCNEESLISEWLVTADADKLYRVCPLCFNKEEV